MPELQHHPGEDDLLELSLGTLSTDQQAAILDHVNSCTSCRTAYDEISRALDATLPASPAAAPPVGFEARVLERIGIRETPRGPVSRRMPVLVAAAAVAGLVLGGVAVGVVAVVRSDDPAAVTATPTSAAPLLKSDGTTVGGVTRGSYDGQDVVVMDVVEGPPGVHYVCRFRLADGTTQDAGEWTVPDSGSAIWIAHEPEGAQSVELVTDSGKVWSSAQLVD